MFWIIMWMLSGLLPAIWATKEMKKSIHRKYKGFYIDDDMDGAEFINLIINMISGPIGGIASLIAGLKFYGENR